MQPQNFSSFLRKEGVENSIRRKSRLDWLADLGKKVTSGKTFFLVLIFQFLGGLQIWLSMGDHADIKIFYNFLGLMAAESVYYTLQSRFSRKYRELELLAFFLCGLDLLVVAVAAPDHLTKQLVAIILGMAVYAAIQYIIKDVGRGRKLKYILVACSILLMILNLAVGEARFGARNWINLGFITFQPMEFVKVSLCSGGNGYAG